MKINYLDLKRQYKTIKQEVDSAVLEVLNDQYFILGNKLEKFEKEFADYLGIKSVIGVNSGTDGLILALRAIDIGKGDEVITTPFSFIATSLAIMEVGAKPVFVDVNKDTYQIDVNSIEEAITKNTKAILPVHIYGAPSSMKSIIKIAKKYDLFVIEDACQAQGSYLYKKKLGTFGDIGVFSFYPSKNLGAYGDSGAIVTNSSRIFKKIIKLRNYGQTKKYYHDHPGINSRMDEVQAAVLSIKLKHLDSWNNERNKIAGHYKSELGNKFKLQEVHSRGFSNYHIFSIETKNRKRLQDYLLKKGIGTLIHYPRPIHKQKSLIKSLGYLGKFTVSERVSNSVLSIPLYPELNEDEVEYIVSALKSY